MVVHFDLKFRALITEFGALVTKLDASWEIGQALEVEELRGGVFAGADEVAGGIEDGEVNFVGETISAVGIKGFEFGEGEFSALGDARVNEVEFGFALAKGFQGAFGDIEAKSFGARFSNAFEDGFVGVAKKPVGDLLDLGFGKWGECALFSHKV